VNTTHSPLYFTEVAEVQTLLVGATNQLTIDAP
jgi:hypothetical protein